MKKSEKIRKALLKGQKIDCWWGMTVVKTSKLSTRISDLRLAGWPIKAVRKENKQCHWNEYFIPKDKLKQANSRYQ